MRCTVLGPVLFFLVAGCRASSAPDDHYSFRVSNALTPPYEVVHGWPEPVLPDGHTLGQTTGVGVDAHNHVFVFHRAGRTQWPPAGTLPRIPRPTVVVYDGATGRLLDRWGADLFVMPHGLKVDSEGNVWVTDIGLHQVMKFTHDGTLLLAVGEAGIAGDESAHFHAPTDVAVLADGSFYVADGYVNARVMKFGSDGRFQFQWGTKGTELGQLDVPHGVAVDGAGRVYVADRGNSRVQIFDSTGHALAEWRNDELGRPYAVLVKSEDLMFIVDGGDEPHGGESRSRIVQLDRRGAVVGSFGGLGRQDGQFILAHAIAIGPDSALYIADAWGNRIQKFVRRNGGQHRGRVHELSNTDDPLRWEIAFESEREGSVEIYALDDNGRNVRKVTATAGEGRTSWGGRWSPDRSRLVLVSNRDGKPGEHRPEDLEIYVVAADGTDHLRLTNNEVPDRAPAWSPDGRHIAFTSLRGGQWEIYVMEADGRNTRRVSEGGGIAARWSPDGQDIVFTSNRDGVVDIYVMAVDGTGLRRLTEGGAVHPAWSPDGSRILYASQADGLWAIRVMNADGSGGQMLRRVNSDAWPRWSPDGRRIVFHDGRAPAGEQASRNTYEIYVMNADGSHVRRLTHNDVFDGYPEW